MIVHAYENDDSNGVINHITEFLINVNQICTMRYVDMYIGDFVKKNGKVDKEIVDDKMLTEITMSNGRTLYVTETMTEILEANNGYKQFGNKHRKSFMCRCNRKGKFGTPRTSAR